MNFSYLIGLVILLLLTAGCKKEVLITNSAEYENYIKKEIKSQKIPALATLIFKKEEIIYEHYFGKANISEKITLAENQLFLLASISKTITAVAILQLYEQGLFQLNDKINDYLPFSVKIPNQTKEVTFQMLLTHTSAINDGDALDDQYYTEKDSPIALEYYMRNYFTPNGIYYNANQNFYDFEPGSKFEYSNTGSALMGVLVEQISGLDFNTYCKKNIFEPLKMNNTFWKLSEINQTIVQPYKYKMRRYIAIPHYTFTDYPNGGLRSTARDMFLFLSAFTMNGAINGYQLLEPNTISKMFTPQIPTIDSEVGLHLFLLNKKNNLWGHDGGEKGVSTIMAFNSSTQIGALIFTNMSDVNLDKILEKTYELGVVL